MIMVFERFINRDKKIENKDYVTWKLVNGRVTTIRGEIWHSRDEQLSSQKEICNYLDWTARDAIFHSTDMR